jgi:hypothetical protein
VKLNERWQFMLSKVAVGMGAIGQVRIMGGAIVLSIATSVFNSYTRPRLQKLLGTPDFEPNHSSSHKSVPDEDVRNVFAQGYDLQMAILAAFAGAQVLAVLLMWKGKQIKI